MTSIHDQESKLFYNIWVGNDDEVIRACERTWEGPFLKCTIYGNTVLHRAVYTERYALAHELLDNHFPDGLANRLLDKNDWGDTVLHNTATSDKGLEITRKLLQKEPRLIQVQNKWGETPMFQATRYGQLKQFKLLSDELDRYCGRNQGGGGGGAIVDYLRFYMRHDETTILHMAILTRNFGMALLIAEKYPELRKFKSKIKMTPLQMLACSPNAFKSGADLGSFFLKKYIYQSFDPDIKDEDEPKGGMIQKAVSILLGMSWKPRCILPIIETVKEDKREHKRAEELAKILVEVDNTWAKGPKPSAELIPQISSADDDNNAEGDDLESGTTSVKRSNSGSIPDAREIPLILAAKYGCVEIIEAILEKFPHSIEYLNFEQQTYLHVAIRHRRMEVFKLRDPEKFPIIKPYLRSIDINGNSILHMVGLSPPKTTLDSNMKNPVLQLSDDLQLLEYLKKLCPKCLINHHNSELKTADQLFATNNIKLHDDAKEYLKRTAEHCTVVIVLIATVAFASAYTVPGGPNSETGYPLLLSKPLFLVFTVTDVLSLGFALTAVVVFLSILTSSFQLKDFRKTFPDKLLLGFTLLFLSVSMMMVAFAATIILMINNKERWTKIGVYVVAFFPVCIFMLSYIPFYVELADSLKYWASQINKYLPRITCNKQSRKQRTRTDR